MLTQKNNKKNLRFQDYLHLPTFLVVKRETAEQLVADQYYVGDPFLVPVFIFSRLWGFFSLGPSYRMGRVYKWKWSMYVCMYVCP